MMILRLLLIMDLSSPGPRNGRGFDEVGLNHSVSPQRNLNCWGEINVIMMLSCCCTRPILMMILLENALLLWTLKITLLMKMWRAPLNDPSVKYEAVHLLELSW